MKPTLFIPVFAMGAAAVMAGCQVSDQRIQQARDPSPPIGSGTLASISANGGTGAAAVSRPTENAATAPTLSYANAERRIVREWRHETTPDGRTIRVAYETEVDEQGRPVGPSRPVKY